MNIFKTLRLRFNLGAILVFILSILLIINFIWGVFFQIPKSNAIAEKLGKRVVFDINQLSDKQETKQTNKVIEELNNQLKSLLPDDDEKIVKKTDNAIEQQNLDNAKEINEISQDKTILAQDKRAQIVIIVGNLGLSKSNTEEALQLPNNVTLGFSPYAANIGHYIEQAVNKKSDILINIPMEPNNYPASDPGQYALLSNVLDTENTFRLDWILSKSDKIVGAYTQYDEKFSLSIANIRPVIQTLKNRELLLAYGRGYSNNIINQVADSLGFPVLIIDVIIDKDINSTSISQKFLKLEQQAKEKGFAIGFISSYPISINQLNLWIKSLENKNIDLVSITDLLNNYKK